MELARLLRVLHCCEASTMQICKRRLHWRPLVYHSGLTVADCLLFATVSCWQLNLLVTEPFRLPQLAFETFCYNMSHLHHHCRSLAATWRRISIVAGFLDCTSHNYCCAWEVTLSSSDKLIIRVTYSLTLMCCKKLPMVWLDCVLRILYRREVVQQDGRSGVYPWEPYTVHICLQRLHAKIMQ